MATIQDIKRRLRSVGNTRKITKALELVAAAKLRRAETRIAAMRPYAERMRELMIGTARATPSRQFPLLEEREDARSIDAAAVVAHRDHEQPGEVPRLEADDARRGLAGRAPHFR